MNLAFGAMTGWGKTWTAQAYTEQNRTEFEGLVLVDYKDEFRGLVEAFDVKRLTVPAGAENVSVASWRRLLDDHPRVQLARAGATTEQFREAMANVVRALAQLDRTCFVVLDEAHKLAPQHQAPEPFTTLATTWHGDGLGVVYITQRFAELEETILAECQAALLGGFQSVRDLEKIEAVEYPVEVHQAQNTRVDRSLPESLLIDGEALALRQHVDEAGNTVGSEWIYIDAQDLRRIDTRDWSLQSTHYGSDRKRIKHPDDS